MYSESASATFIGVCSRKALISCICSCLMSAMTSSCFSGLPATIPAATAASIPFIPPVLGTMTLFTFLIIFPLTSTLTCEGFFPSSCLAIEAA